MTNFNQNKEIKSLLFTISLLFSILFIGCKKEEFHIEQKFVHLYVELRLASVSYGNKEKKSKEINRIILKKYGLEALDYHMYMEDIINRPIVWADFQSQVLEVIKKLEEQHKGE